MKKWRFEIRALGCHLAAVKGRKAQFWTLRIRVELWVLILIYQPKLQALQASTILV